jgi:hypothetical protein
MPSKITSNSSNVNKKKSKKETKSKKGIKKVQKKIKREIEEDDDSEEDSPTGFSDNINETFDFDGYLTNLDNKIDKQLREKNRENKNEKYQDENEIDEKYEEKLYVESLDKNADKINILEKFVNTNGKIVILIIGMPCTNKSQIAKILSEDLNNNLRPIYTKKRVNIINLKDYFLESNYKVIDVKAQYSDKIIKYNIYETTDNYDWEALNTELIKDNGGSIIFGNFIDIEKLKFKINYSFFLDMSISLCKKIMIDKQILPIKKDSKDSDFKLNSYFEHVFIPSYEKIKEQVKINKFFNVKNGSDEEINKIYDSLYKSLTLLIQETLD